MPPWKLAEGGEGHSDGGVDVAARDLRAEQQAEDSSDTPPALVGEDNPGPGNISEFSPPVDGEEIPLETEREYTLSYGAATKYNEHQGSCGKQ